MSILKPIHLRITKIASQFGHVVSLWHHRSLFGASAHDAALRDTFGHGVPLLPFASQSALCRHSQHYVGTVGIMSAQSPISASTQRAYQTALSSFEHFLVIECTSLDFIDGEIADDASGTALHLIMGKYA